MKQMTSVTASPGLKNLKCTQCGGAIELRGGHNVRTIICQYCGACLDRKKEFAVLHSFLNQKRPFMPLKIGARGKLKGVDFTVIGVLQYEQREDGEVYRWLEYLLFSYTHGYVYLCYEDGHWVMMHEVKDLPETSIDLRMPRKAKFVVRDKKFKVFECADARLSYVEGELTWRAKQNEAISYLDAVCPPYIYSIEKRAAEIEYFWGEYISQKEMGEAFKIESLEPTTVFACQPFICSPLFEAVSKGALAASFLALFLYFFISNSGTYVASHDFGSEIFTKGGVSSEFTIDSPNELYGVTVYAPHLSNAWSFFDIKVIDASETAELCGMPAEISYYSGYEGGEHWSEGSRDAVAYFKIPESGTYKLAVEGEGGKGDLPDTAFALSHVNFEIRKGVRLGHHTLAWFVIALLIAAPYFVRMLKLEHDRWKDDEDDD